MNRPVKLIALAAIASTFSACALVNSSLDKKWEPVETKEKPQTYDEACYNPKDAKETPFCPGYDPSKDYPLD